MMPLSSDLEPTLTRFLALVYIMRLVPLCHRCAGIYPLVALSFIMPVSFPPHDDEPKLNAIHLKWIFTYSYPIKESFTF